jgi:hypothetical protein
MERSITHHHYWIIGPIHFLLCVQGGPDSDFEYSTQAYTGYEPTSMRAIRSVV